MWHKLIVGCVVAIASVSVVLGFSWPDGKVDESGTAKAALTPRLGERSPVKVSRTVPWPGLPDTISVDESTGTVNWCDDARLEPASGPAVYTFGAIAVGEAYCDVVSFMFEQRYSALAVPRTTYELTDFDPLRKWLSAEAYDKLFLTKALLVVAEPDSADARKDLGLPLVHLSNDRPGAGSLSAGPDHVFYGNGAGYDGRAVWINPTWHRTGLAVDQRTGLNRLSITMTASAALPVYNTATQHDAMMLVKTEATFFMKRRTEESGRLWRIDGWEIVTPGSSFAPLVVAE